MGCEDSVFIRDIGGVATTTPFVLYGTGISRRSESPHRSP